MKPAAPTSPPRYRNDRVYRSAERLIASVNRRRRKRALHAILLVTAVTGGLAAWLVQIRPVSESAAAPGFPKANSTMTAGPAVHGREPRPFAMPERIAASDLSPGSAMEKSGQNISQNGDEIAYSASTAVPASSSLQPAEMSRGTSPAAWLLAARANSGLILRGELHSVTRLVAKVEFRLSLVPGPLGGTVEGLVHLNAPPRLAEHFSVSGTWINRTLVLREKDDATASGRNPAEYQFTIELPEIDDSGEVTGLWIHGSQGQGRLRLQWVPRP